MGFSVLYPRLQESLRGALAELVRSGEIPADVSLENVVLESPRDPSHGDLATNAAMVLAKPAGKAPRVLADALIAHIKEWPEVASAEVAGPGFVNIRLKPEALVEQIGVATRMGEAYGKVTVGAGRKALVEYVSINPTGPVHVGHGRNAVFGDAIANLLEQGGFEVWREYLVNDAGNQMKVLVRSLLARYRQLYGQQADVPADGYPGEYLIDIAEALKARDGDKWLNADEEIAFAELRGFAADQCLALIKADIETLGIKFDRYFSEYEMHQGDAMTRALDLLRAKGLIYQGTLPPPKGKEIKDYVPVEMTLFKATEFGLPEDQAVYNREGKPTYFGQDIAYHWDKLNRGYDYLPVVVDVRQAGSFKPLTHAIEVMSGRKGVYHPVAYELVKVMRDGKPVNLSKRAGNIVALKDVLDEIGADAFRFIMLTVKPTTELVFDMAKAVEKSMENPVFYVQYAHARLCSVGRQAAELGLNPAGVVGDGNVLVNGPARDVLRLIMLYPQVVEHAARSIEPHRLTVFATEFAAAIHRWYGAEKFIDTAHVPATEARLALCVAARSVLKDVLRICGVSAPEVM